MFVNFPHQRLAAVGDGHAVDAALAPVVGGERRKASVRRSTPEMATSPASPAHCGAVSGGTTWPEASVTLVEMVCTPFSSA